METLSPNELLQQWQVGQIFPAGMQSNHSKIKQAMPLKELRQLWQYGDFPTEATIGQILYNLTNLQLDVQALTAQVIVLEAENQRLLAHLNAK